MSETLKSTTDASFKQDVLESSRLVLVDFWAPWCQPCKMILPQIEAFAQQDHCEVYKLNVQDNPNTPQEYGVQGIPTLLLFKQGELVATHVGAQVNQAMLAEWVEPHLADA